MRLRTVECCNIFPVKLCGFEEGEETSFVIVDLIESFKRIDYEEMFMRKRVKGWR